MTDAKQDMKKAKSELGHNSRLNWRGMLAWYGTAAAVGLATGWTIDNAKKPTVISTGELTASQKAEISANRSQGSPQDRLRAIMAKEKEKCEANPSDNSKLCQEFRGVATKPVPPTAVAAAASDPQAAARQAAQARLAQANQGTINAQEDRNPTKTWQQVATTKGVDIGFGLGAALLLSFVTSRTRIGRGIPDIIHGPQSYEARLYNNGLKNEYYLKNAQRAADMKAGLTPGAAATEKAQDFRSMLERQIPDGWFSIFRPGSPVLRASADTPGAVATEEGHKLAKAGATRLEKLQKKTGGPSTP